jgi:hypothetical protein
MFGVLGSIPRTWGRGKDSILYFKNEELVEKALKVI